MIKTIKVIIGLPGSGKSLLAKDYYPDHVVLDDFGSENGPSIEDLIRTLQGDKPVIVIDPNLCYPGIRRAAEQTFFGMGLHVDYIWFANDPVTCRENVLNRNDGREVMESINRLTALYAPDGPTIPCWSSESEAAIKAASQVSKDLPLAEGLPAVYIQDGAIVTDYPDGTIVIGKMVSPQGSLISKVTLEKNFRALGASLQYKPSLSLYLNPKGGTVTINQERNEPS